MSYRKRSQEPDHIDRIYGDPGVGAVLSDPLAPRGPRDTPDPAAGPPDPDSPPPRHHGDWLPTSRGQVRKPYGAPHPMIGRRRSRNGMPKALFREGDGTSLDDLRALGRMSARP